MMNKNVFLKLISNRARAPVASRGRGRLRSIAVAATTSPMSRVAFRACAAVALLLIAHKLIAHTR